ncbi:MAG: nodulation protein NodH [Heliomarina sp.]|uniref:nodulation protein NodH n=1 Tax=Heliomarina sp. TaxID=2917556 RepID=UPI0040598B0B
MFDYFVVFAEMRTGSNLLETNLNAFDGMSCLGEAFNPHFIGYPNKSELLGIDKETRDADPSLLIDAVKSAPGLSGFRYFHDHDPRVLDVMLDDPRCAKIILTRNPLESYVSWKIAKATNQWKLTDVKRRKEALADFDGVEFAGYVGELQNFQVKLLNRMQVSGQTGFYIAYEDLRDLDVMNGLAQWLGCGEKLEGLDTSLKIQNPGPVAEKVSNPREMERALADLDAFNLTRTPNFEPRRGPAVPSYIAGNSLPLLFMPIPGGPVETIANWMGELEGVPASALKRKMTQKDLRQWLRKQEVHRSFTVLRHPADRVHEVFCRKILNTGAGSYMQIRDTLRRQFKLRLPEGAPDESYSVEDHRAAFKGFLGFVRSNLAGQTGIRVDASWATQAQIVAGFAEFKSPDIMVRENDTMLLSMLASHVGITYPRDIQRDEPCGPYVLADVYDNEIADKIGSIYQRDFMIFAMRPWTPPGLPRRP